MSHCTDARIESFGSIGVAVKPGVAVGTRKPRTPSSVRAQMTATSATDARPIQRFEPVSDQPPSGVGVAVVRMPAGSDPASGSVRPKQPSASPVAIAGSQRSFCASLP